jgi:hypothetical protein
MKSRRSRPSHPNPFANGGETRALIINTAARLMADEGVNDYSTAKRRAIARLNLPEGKNLPSNLEIETALKDYLALFHGARWQQNTARWRKLALEAMDFFEPFEPKLIGAVLSGVVTPGTEIHLHLTADGPEAVAFFLQDRNIPFEQSERKLRFGGDRQATFPAFRFTAQDVVVEACVFDHAAIRELPLSPVDGKPVKRANKKDVEGLLEK